MRIHALGTASTVHFAAKDESTTNAQKSHIGKTVGLVAGLGIGTGLVISQMKSLKTMNGKRNVIESLNVRDKCLNDIEQKIAQRGADGKILQPEGGVSERTKKAVKDFKKTLIIWGGIITALTTTLGALADNSITQVRIREEQELKEKKQLT